MYRARWTKRAQEEYEYLHEQAARRYKARQASGKKRASKQEGLFKQIDKAIRLLVSNPRHPGLHTHKFHSMPHPFRPGDDVFVAYAQSKTPGAYRIFWCYGPEPNEMTIVAITPHP